MEIHSYKTRIKWFALVILLLGLWVFLTVWTGSNCLFKEIIGLPCPGCGSTRSFLALIHGDVHAALVWHPLMPLTLIIALSAAVLLIIRFTRGYNPFDTKWFIWVIVILAAVYIAVYIFRMVYLFPHTPPLDYNHDSLLGRLVQNFR